MEDAGKLIRKGFVVLQQGIGHGGKTVIGNNRRYCGEQTHGGCDEGLGDAGRHRGQCRLLNLCQPPERVHDAPDGAKQTHIRTGGADRRQERQTGLQPLVLPGEGHPHCPLGTFHNRIGVPALLAQPGKLLETGPEQGFHAGKRCWIGVHLPV